MAERTSRIAVAFSRAASQYEAAASVQREVAQRLAARIERLPLSPEPRVLEIGAGTGFLTRLLLDRIPGGQWLITDISAEMLAKCESAVRDPRVRFQVVDGERPLPGPFDLIASNLALQWFDDVASAIRGLIASLAPGGLLVFSTLGGKTFQEWRKIHTGLGLPCGLRNLPEAAALSRAWPAGGTGAIEEELLTVRYSDAKAFVRALKTVGASTPRQDYRPLPPGAFKSVLERMGSHCDMTYHLIYGSFSSSEQVG
jgi:malonyl-CoA O-methyltransferase